MRKLKLQLADLAVDSFATAANRGVRATVHAHAPTMDCTVACTVDPTCYDETCNHYNTCQFLTCDGVCTTGRCTAGETGSCAGCTSVIGCASDDGQCASGVCNQTAQYQVC